MKTFLWTSLFWIIVVIAWLLCLGFGNLWTQVLDNEWLAKFMPKNVQTLTCDPVVSSAMEWIDWCEKAQEADCNLVTTVESWDLQGIQEAINDMMLSQKEMQSEMKEALESIEQKMVSVSSDSTLDKAELEKQAKAEKKQELQKEMEEAISEERYEDAAKLRDQIKELD